jgi:hypothetical protein
MGVCVLDAIDENFSNHIAQWYDNPSQDINIKANNIQETLKYLVDTYPYKKDSFLEEQLMFI